jgi:hypothetical protein
MIRFYKWGDNVPEWIVEIKSEVIPVVTFNGFVMVYKFKGEIILKHLFGESIIKIAFGKSIIKIANGYDCNVEFKNTVMKQKSSPLNILRQIKCITKALREPKL